MIRAAVGLASEFTTWVVFGFVGLVAVDALIPGMGMRIIDGALTMGATLADSLPAGVVAGLVLVLPAFYLGNRVTVGKIYADNQRKIDADREKYTL